jgi:1,4-alpha-glucan branching enzyme
MAGDEWQKYAGLRALFGYMFGMSGKKLLFQGGEIAQRREWHHDHSVDWHLLEYEPHRGVQQLVADLNHLYRSEPALHEKDNDPAGFEWVDCNDSVASVYSFLRRPATGSDRILVVLNLTPVVREGYRIGVPGPGLWTELLNTDSAVYWGSNVGNAGGVHAEYVTCHGRPYSLHLTLPPLSAMFFKGQV